MKNANELPKYDGSKLINLTFQYLETKLIYTALELNIFNYLETGKSIDELAKSLHLDEKNLEYFLKSLVSMDYIKYENGIFGNTDETNYFLNEKSNMYLGENLLYWKDLTNIDNIHDLLKNGADRDNANKDNGSDFFDFRSMGRGARNSMYLGRVQGFVKLMKSLFDENKSIRVLDLGCGSGILSVEIAKNFPNAKCILIDQAQVINFTKDVIAENKVEDRVEVEVGDFNTYIPTEKYDLIITSGVLDFVKDMDNMSDKIYNSLDDDGYLYVSTHQMNDDFTKPKNFILGWLSGNLNGLDILKPESLVIESLNKYSLVEVEIESHPRTIFKKGNTNE